MCGRARGERRSERSEGLQNPSGAGGGARLRETATKSRSTLYVQNPSGAGGGARLRETATKSRSTLYVFPRSEAPAICTCGRTTHCTHLSTNGIRSTVEASSEKKSVPRKISERGSKPRGNHAASRARLPLNPAWTTWTNASTRQPSNRQPVSRPAVQPSSRQVSVRSSRYGRAAGPTGRWRCRRPVPFDVPCAGRAPGPDLLAVRRCLPDCRNAGYRLPGFQTPDTAEVVRSNPIGNCA